MSIENVKQSLRIYLHSAEIQQEASECGLAAVAMVCGVLGIKNIKMRYLREKYTVSSRGMTFANLISILESINIKANPVSTIGIGELSIPSILFWNQEHYVVLLKKHSAECVIFDPAVGKRIIEYEASENKFSGVALEIETKQSDIRYTAIPITSRKARAIEVHRIARNFFKKHSYHLYQILFISLIIETCVLIVPSIVGRVIDSANTGSYCQMWCMTR